MALIKNHAFVKDPWTPAEEEGDLPAGPVIVSLSRWKRERDTLITRRDPVGVRLEADDPIEDIVPDLNRFGVVVLTFPVFRDGRSYSRARLLRERHGYAGELRASGDVLRDQWHFMERCGFDAFDVAETVSEEEWRSAMSEISVWYQPSSDARAPAGDLRLSRDLRAA